MRLPKESMEEEEKTCQEQTLRKTDVNGAGRGQGMDYED